MIAEPVFEPGVCFQALHTDTHKLCIYKIYTTIAPSVILPVEKAIIIITDNWESMKQPSKFKLKSL